jgi:hypothetical protein
VNSLNLGDTWQVRELGISVTSGFTVVGHLHTFLPWAPRSSSSAGTPLGVSWIWPMMDRPHRTTATNWYDDALAPEVAPGGRLANLLNAGKAAQVQRPARKHSTTKNVPVTWALDPMLVSDVKAMTSDYRVKGPTATTDGTGATAAKGWMTSLHAAVTAPGASVLSTPYGDPDIVAANRLQGGATTIGLATAAGQAVLRTAVNPTQLLSSVDWPPSGLVDARSASALLANGENTLVLSDTALPPLIPQNNTPSARTTLSTTGGPIDAVLTDSSLSATVTTGFSNPDGARVSLQRYLAETLMIYAEAPDPLHQRDIVVAPNRRWAPPPQYAAALLADTGKVPWITPVGLSAVASSADSGVQRQPLNYPESARHNELPLSYLHRVAGLNSQISDYNSILPQDNPQTKAYAAASWEALSSAWRSQHALATNALDALTAEVATAMRQVRISSHPGSFVTLTSHGGNVPVTVENDLAIPVNIVVQLKATRLTLSNHGRVTVPLPPHQHTVVNVHTAAKTSGVFPVTVQLLTPDGRHHYGDPVRLYVRSTVYGTITLVITGAATGVLMVAVAIRLTRRALAARRSSVTASP